MIMSIHTKKAFDKIQRPFMTKTLKLAIIKNFHNLIKGIYEKHLTTYINAQLTLIPNNEKLDDFL